MTFQKCELCNKQVAADSSCKNCDRVLNMYRNLKVLIIHEQTPVLKVKGKKI